MERLPEYFRDTMDWFMGRSRHRKGEGKENVAGESLMRRGPGGSWDGGGGGMEKSRSAEFTICESFKDEEDFRRLVAQPPGLDRNEWLATHCLAFFNHINALYGAVSEFCTPETCPVMCGPGHVQYPWVDDRGKKWKYSAPHYVDCVMSFTEKTVSSQDAFPTKYGHNFPAGFDSVVRRVSRLMWQVLAHLHACHSAEISQLGLRGQTAVLTAHFSAFCAEFAALDSPKDLILLAELARQSRPFSSRHPPPSATPPAPAPASPSGEGEEGPAGASVPAVGDEENRPGDESVARPETELLICSKEGGEGEAMDTSERGRESPPPPSSAAPPAVVLSDNNNSRGGSWSSGSVPSSYGLPCAQTA